jgi:hypothetical protein
MAPENPKTAPAQRAISMRDRIVIFFTDPARYSLEILQASPAGQRKSVKT